jgi:DNA polymerase-3 subunit gamma/tau
LKRFAGDLLGYFRSLTVVKVSGPSRELLDMPEQEMTRLSEIAARHSLENLTNIFHLLLKGIEEMQYSPLPKMALEMAFVKIITAGDLVPVATLLERLASLSKNSQCLENTNAEQTTGHNDATPAHLEMSTPYAVQPQKTNSTGEPQPTTAGEEQAARHENLSGKIEAQQEKSAADQAPEPASEMSEMPEAAVAQVVAEEKEVRKHWAGFMEHVKDRKPWMAHALSLCASAREKDGELILKYDDMSECKILQGKENSKLLNEYALDFFQKDLKIKIIVKSAGVLEGDMVSGQNLPQEERRALASDPLVQMTAEIMDGQVSGIRTGPRSR